MNNTSLVARWDYRMIVYCVLLNSSNTFLNSKIKSVICTIVVNKLDS